MAQMSEPSPKAEPKELSGSPADQVLLNPTPQQNQKKDIVEVEIIPAYHKLADNELVNS